MKKSHITITRICVVGILAALYFVLSLTLKIPMSVGNISLDLGYIALMAGASLFGPVVGALTGAIGAGVESILLSPYGLSVGWVVMNAIIGIIVGCLFAYTDATHLPWGKCMVICVGTIVLAVGLGVMAKTFIECALYSIPLAVKLPKSLVAWGIDSLVMLIGLPISGMIYSKVPYRIRSIFVR